MTQKRTLGKILLLAAIGAALAWATSTTVAAEEGAAGTQVAAVKVTFVKSWGTQGAGAGELNFPIGIAMTEDGRLMVTDHYNSRVQCFDKEGKYLSEFKTLPSPGSIAIDLAGTIYVAHFPGSQKQMDKHGRGNFVSTYSADGQYLRRWGKGGTGDGEFDCPGGMAFGPGTRLYIADQTNHRVQIFDTNGRYLWKWGSYGNESAQFGGKSSANSRTGGPQFIAFDSAGHAWTTEGANGRVQEFSAEGEFVQTWGDNEDKAGSFGGTFSGFKNQPTKLQGPVALCFDAKNRLWVTAVSGRIQCFERTGKFLGGVGSQGTEEEQFLAPHGIVVDGGGNMFVVDAYNHRIQKFSVAEIGGN